MNKIICDICGTSYPDTANQCPICGYARPVNGKSGEEGGETPASRRENYTYVKGGRFSKKNVKKRNERMLKESQKTGVEDIPGDEEERDDGGKGLVIAIVVLLIAVIAVAAYITIRFFVPFSGQPDQGVTPPSTTAPVVEQTENTEQTEPTIETTEATVAEAEITLDTYEVKLDKKGAEHSLVVTVTPEGNTETITYNSANDAIATVSEDGKIIATGIGETTITVTCGELTAECKVVCEYIEESEYKAPYRLKKEDVSITVGYSFLLKFVDADDKEIPVVFENPKPDVCSVEGNKVTGLAKGRSDISVTYNGETYTCIVRVN